MNKTEIISLLVNGIAQQASMEPDSILANLDFHSLSMDSIDALFLLEAIEKELDMELDTLIFWDYPTIDTLATYLHARLTGTSVPK